MTTDYGLIEVNLQNSILAFLSITSLQKKLTAPKLQKIAMTIEAFKVLNYK